MVHEAGVDLVLLEESNADVKLKQGLPGAVLIYNHL